MEKHMDLKEFAEKKPLMYAMHSRQNWPARRYAPLPPTYGQMGRMKCC